MGAPNVIRGVHPDQRFFLPLDIRDLLPKDDISYIIVQILKILDLTEFNKKYRQDGRGGAHFDPTCMIGILLLAAWNGDRSSRKIERECKKDAQYWIVGHWIKPDHSTIFRFKQQYATQLKGLFKQFSRMLIESGATKVDLLALDGTKMPANASLEANRTAAWLSNRLETEFDDGLKQDMQQEGSTKPNQLSDQVVDEESTDNTHTHQYQTAFKKLEERQLEVISEKEQQMLERKEKEEASGKNKPGPKLQIPSQEPPSEAKVNLTDPESQIMKSRHGFIQGYNVQVMTNQDQFILALSVTDDQNDINQFIPMVEEIKPLVEDSENYSDIIILADTGYFSTKNVLSEEENGPKFIIAPKKLKKNVKPDSIGPILIEIDEFCRSQSKQTPAIPVIASMARFVYELYLDRDKPANANEVARDVMTARCNSPSGKKMYDKRKYKIEPVFGQLKHNFRFNRFQGKGKVFCEGEISVMALCMNICRAAKMGVLSKIISNTQQMSNTTVSSDFTCSTSKSNLSSYNRFFFFFVSGMRSLSVIFR